MNEIQTNNFDYSVLDSSTAEYLKDRENSMSKTLERTSEKLGEDLYKAQQKLADHNGGVFEDWYTALGFKSRNVYNFINRHKYVLQNLQDPSDLETFQELGSSLQIEMSKPSADPEINQKVFDGDIKTHKEYKELEKKYKEQQERLEKAESMTESTKNWFHDVSSKLEKRNEENNILQSKLEEMENREPERIEVEKEITKEVFPEDYEANKKMLADLKSKVKRETQSAEKLREELKKYTEAFSDPSEAYEESQVKRLERESSINAYKLSISIQKFIEENAVETYKVSSVIKSDDAAKKRLTENIELLENFTTNMMALLNGRIISN